VIALLEKHDVQFLVDVRPPGPAASRSFRRDALKGKVRRTALISSLARAGWPSKDPSCYDEQNRVNYEGMHAAAGIPAGDPATTVPPGNRTGVWHSYVARGPATGLPPLKKLVGGWRSPRPG